MKDAGIILGVNIARGVNASLAQSCVRLLLICISVEPHGRCVDIVVSGCHYFIVDPEEEMV